MTQAEGARQTRRVQVSLRFLLRSPAAAVAVLFLLLVVAAAALAPLIAPHEPSRQSLRARLLPPMPIERSQPAHPLGTDQLGRDVLSRLIFGARVSILVGLSVVLLASTVGTALGLAAGYLGGRVDTILMRIVDVFLAFPFLLLAIVFMATLGQGLRNIILVLALTGWVDYARTVRAQVLALRETEYVTAAEALGVRKVGVMFRHMLPNILASVLVISSLQIGAVIVAEASLTFLGLGVPPAIPTWGTMLATGREYMSSAWWLATLPGLAITLTVLSVNTLGDWLRDRLDPYL
ncbi:MAG: ABC transporter permease [Trueperaceae bacterium]|nr:ABC transporter permease [Trueperaceae bacterium]